jgi:hypothetical protein
MAAIVYSVLDEDQPISLAGDLHPDIGAEVDPIGFFKGTRIQLRPIIYELKVLTKDRGTRRFGDVINFAQERLIDEAERQLFEYGQIRIIVLKARQMGQSTVIEAIIFALSILYQDFQSLIISHEAESAEHILGMTKRYWTTYPFRRFHEEQYNGRKQLAWSDLGSNIVVATAKNVGAGRSKTLHAMHASEVAFWDNPSELITGLRQAIPSIGLTAIFYESTANGIGNFFHSTWLDAEASRSEFTPMFFPWHIHPEYIAKNIPRQERGKYTNLKDPDADERKLIGMGISEARLLWRRWAIVNLCQGSLDKFKQEYPTTPHEAFLSTGRNVFRLNDLLAHYQPIKPKVGDLKRVGRKVQFFENPHGALKVYRSPSADQSWGIYQLGADPTHTTAGDKACGQVINRRTLEQAAVFSAHVDPIEFGKQLFLLGEWYNDALIAPEAEGPGYATVGHLLGANYPFVWNSQKVTNTPGKVSEDVFGWRTNRSTKHLAIGQLVNNFAAPLTKIGQSTYGLLIHDEQTFTELKDYVTDDSGGFMNGDGSFFDDCVMALGIAVATHFIEPPLPAYTRDESHLQLVKEVNEKVAATIQTTDDKPEDDMGIPAWRREMEEE